MSNRLQKLSDESFVKVALRVFQVLDNLMTRYGEDSTNPYGHGGALSFGWDLPTASMTFPRAAARWYAMIDESKRRGIKSVAHERTRNSTRGKFKFAHNRGKIVYKVTGPIKYAA